MIGICSPSQSASQKHNQEKKSHIPLRTSQISILVGGVGKRPWERGWQISRKMCPSCLIIIQPCYFDYGINKPFTCSCCVICISCAVHVISTYYVRKGSLAFFTFITQKSSRLENPIIWIPAHVQNRAFP